ncbi:MAG: hypothetical protein D8M57_18150 [Candidatus Scalindua sp. AMX11]|nr:MAG: hypothetical protein DWQ00_08220 [Candidatus Scalindua sp.]NOG83301.1 hypothetical protein [Planctomycetota bacterium]RZV76799.1 MAG: hypothetical protein EX341_12255 [Candidatus Scalindua sp. SCAELEC01]TDE63446.1 MAG: hypothetical protein D8M57_18150 [Candidatus Scalindua sp. AMX11]GJQ57483.1 MAG: hypothetical protein SCALA701_02840 [Candidatus Scalindua sp.]
MTKEMLNIVRIVIKTVWQYYQDTGELLPIKDFLAIPRLLGFPFLNKVTIKSLPNCNDGWSKLKGWGIGETVF